MAAEDRAERAERERESKTVEYIMILLSKVQDNIQTRWQRMKGFDKR